jgi:hypothetical protein
VSLAARPGLIDPPGLSVDRRPGILLHGGAEAIERAWPAADAALRHRSDYRLVMAVPDADIDRVRLRFSHERVVALPAPSPLGRMLWRRRLGIALALDAGLPEQVIAEAIRRLPERRVAGQAIGNAVARLLLSVSRSNHLNSIADLQSALDSPGTILCLGNGPTSEDPALDDHADGALFRVNWTWRGRGRWMRPDAVFTADPDLPPEDLRPILVFPDARTGLRILLQHLLAGRGPRSGHVFADALSPPLVDQSAAEVPTNGAVMIAIAAALAPDTLVIAGMDLYRHPAGRYPGSGAMEGYARGHSADCDLAVIARALDAFPGRVVLRSPNLADALGR